MKEFSGPQSLVVRSGKGTCRWESGQESESIVSPKTKAMQQFTDSIEMIERVPRQHSGWQSVTYQGQRYQLNGGIRTFWFICLSNPIKSRKQKGNS